MDLPRPLPVMVDADYSYRAPLGFVGIEPGDIAELISNELSEVEALSLEAAVTMLGERLLVALDEVSEVTVTISGRPDAVGLPTSSVSATFRR